MKLAELDELLKLWEQNNLQKLWTNLIKLSLPDFACNVAWMTTMIRDTGEVRLSQWLVWLETKSNNQ